MVYVTEAEMPLGEAGIGVEGREKTAQENAVTASLGPGSDSIWGCRAGHETQDGLHERAADRAGLGKEKRERVSPRDVL